MRPAEPCKMISRREDEPDECLTHGGRTAPPDEGRCYGFPGASPLQSYYLEGAQEVNEDG